MAGCMMAGTLAVTGLTSTAALHMCFSPYVHSMTFDKESDTFHVEKMNLFSRKYFESFKLSEMEASTGFNPFTNFSAKGKTYFCHELERLYTFKPEFYLKMKEITNAKRAAKPKPLNPHDESIL